MDNEAHRGLVWIVEDSPLEAEMARRSLAATQDTEVVADGSLALERFASGVVPDAVVLDWQLPSVSGVEVCRVLRSTHDANSLPILMLTAQGRKRDIAFAIEAGANDYVTKPYDVAELVARVQTLVRTSRLHRAQKRRARQLELAANVGAALTRARDSIELAQRCAEVLAEHFETTFAGVWVRDASGLVLAGKVGHATSSAPAALVEESAATGKVVERSSSVAVPLVLRDHVVGVAVVETHPGNESATILSTIAHLLALGVARAQAEGERADLLERERVARADAEEANRSKDEFLAVVSHELRTPLNAITGWAAMLNSGALDPVRSKRAIETIERNARAQKQLIEDLLDVTRIASGKLRIERGRIDISSCIEMAVESVRLVADSKGVAVSARIIPAMLVIMGDAERVQQIVWNLLSNAIKFTPRGGSVELDTEVKDDAVEVTVRDNGRGITPEFLPQVFERFRQADGSATRTSGGLGLGLAIVRKLVSLHGGTIQASSEGLGRGAVFRVRFPITTADPENLRAEPSRQSSMMPRPELEGLRVLVVDDEPDARDLMRTLLELYGIHVTTSGSAADAYEVIQTSKQDVLLSDVAMPGEDGLSLIRRVRQLPPAAGGGIYAVAVTAYARDEDRSGAVDAGFSTHVSKPLNATELFNVLSAFVNR